MPFKEFCFSTIDELIQEAEALNLQLKFSKNITRLADKVRIGKLTLPNSMAYHPMEGCDGNVDGSPGELTKRRYIRMAEGGAGLIWFEAVAVVPEGRAFSRQLWINGSNVEHYKHLHERIVEKAKEKFGDSHTPVCIMQLTHSGRFSKPQGKPAPIVACANPYLDPLAKDNSMQIISDEELEMLEEDFVKAAVLARQAGFDGVDIKACHRYLNSELLSAYTRKGKYGETFEGRTRFLLNVVDRVRNELGRDFVIASRLNIYDGIPYPYGWGVDEKDFRIYDLSEPCKLVRELENKGVSLINITMGTPYYNPHVNRPYDKGGYIPEEHPLEGVARLLKGAEEIQRTVPEIAVVGTGYSWLREFSPYLAAGTLAHGGASLIGFGREGFAYPDFAVDILSGKGMKKEKCCISCGKCAQILRAGGTAGCVIRDSKVYAPVYKEFCESR